MVRLLGSDLFEQIPFHKMAFEFLDSVFKREAHSPRDNVRKKKKKSRKEKMSFKNNMQKPRE